MSSLSQARQSMESGHYAEAERLYLIAAEEDSSRAAAWQGVGVARSKMGRMAEAVEAFRRAVEADASYAEAFNNMGIALDATGRPDEGGAELPRGPAAAARTGEGLDQPGSDPDGAEAPRGGRGVRTGGGPAKRRRPPRRNALLGSALACLRKYEEARPPLAEWARLAPLEAEAHRGAGGTSAGSWAGWKRHAIATSGGSRRARTTPGCGGTWPSS